MFKNLYKQNLSMINSGLQVCRRVQYIYFIWSLCKYPLHFDRFTKQSALKCATLTVKIKLKCLISLLKINFKY